MSDDQFEQSMLYFVNKDIQSRLQRQANSSLANVPGLMMGAGGVLIEAGGTIYGAVGVSGAPSGETDEACAKAGVAAVIDDLEMAD